MNLFEEENQVVREQFDLDKVLQFQLTHDVQVIRGEDYQYMAYIDKIPYFGSLTPLYALWFGIMQYEHSNKKV